VTNQVIHQVASIQNQPVSDICNCDKSEDYFAENKSWIIPLIVTAVIGTLEAAAAIVGVVYKIFYAK